VSRRNEMENADSRSTVRDVGALASQLLPCLAGH
jgi:hypothetical protein